MLRRRALRLPFACPATWWTCTSATSCAAGSKSTRSSTVYWHGRLWRMPAMSTRSPNCNRVCCAAPGQIAGYSPNSTWFVTSRLDTTRYLAHGFWQREKWRDMSRWSDSTSRHARHDRRNIHDTCSGSSQQRGLGWTCPPHFFQKLFPRLMQIQSTKH